MNVLGISGLPHAVDFKRTHWPGLDCREYRMSQGHDSAAVLVTGGEMVAAAAEERFTGQKHTGAFPAHAIAYCLSAAGLPASGVDLIAHAFDYAPYRELYALNPLSQQLYEEVFSPQALRAELARSMPALAGTPVRHVPHHLAHAASAFYTSGWDECLVLVIDGMGEVEGASVYAAAGGRLRRLHEISANDSIGILYSLVTFHLGFDFNADEYKIMGLAPYGDPGRFRSFFDEAVQFGPNGSIRIPALRLNRTLEERERYLSTRRYLAAALGPERRPDEELCALHRDAAAALQDCLNRAVLHIARHFGAATGHRRLALAGGVALNCTANGLLMRSGLFDDIYVQPAAGDDGSALGAALECAAACGEVRNVRMPVPLLGPEYSAACVEAALSEFGDAITVTRFDGRDRACRRAADLIASGRVLGWYTGRMEFGPRALGNRSIVADPGHPEMRDRINAMVKKREAFRPFAPAVTVEEVDRWFEVPPGSEFPYMIATVPVRPEHRAALPAVTHVDGSARVQTVSRTGNGRFHALLQEVGRATGREMVLNTSFNVKGQPIVNTPREAVATFLATGIDDLFIDDIQIARRERAGVR